MIGILLALALQAPSAEPPPPAYAYTVDHDDTVYLVEGDQWTELGHLAAPSTGCATLVLRTEDVVVARCAGSTGSSWMWIGDGVLRRA
jgi:hypothetical protein